MSSVNLKDLMQGVEYKVVSRYERETAEYQRASLPCFAEEWTFPDRTYVRHDACGEVVMHGKCLDKMRLSDK